MLKVCEPVLRRDGRNSGKLVLQGNVERNSAADGHLELVLKRGEHHLVRIVVIQQNNYDTSPEMSSKADGDDER